MSSALPDSIRPARPSDAASVGSLLGELGYSTASDEAAARLERLLAGEDAGVLVYELGGAAVGLVAYQLMYLLERGRPQCRITTLVVDIGERRRGVAGALVEAVESVARDAGCFRLEVTTQLGRDDPVEFYFAYGFHERPRRLVKPLV